MKIHDSVLGGLFVVLAAALWFGSGALANPTGQPYGPDFFPRILAAGLALAGLVLAAGGVRQRQPLGELAAWTGSPRAVVRVLLVPVGVVLFVVLAEPLGFIACAVLLLAALQIADEVPPVPAILVAVVAALLVHSAFYLGLNVQLPWGLLAPLRW